MISRNGVHLDMVAGLINIIKINYKRVQSLKEFKISSLRNAAGGRVGCDLGYSQLD